MLKNVIHVITRKCIITLAETGTVQSVKLQPEQNGWKPGPLIFSQMGSIFMSCLRFQISSPLWLYRTNGYFMAFFFVQQLKHCAPFLDIPNILEPRLDFCLYCIHGDRPCSTIPTFIAWFLAVVSLLTATNGFIVGRVFSACTCAEFTFSKETTGLH